MHIQLFFRSSSSLLCWLIPLLFRRSECCFSAFNFIFIYEKCYFRVRLWIVPIIIVYFPLHISIFPTWCKKPKPRTFARQQNRNESMVKEIKWEARRGKKGKLEIKFIILINYLPFCVSFVCAPVLYLIIGFSLFLFFGWFYYHFSQLQHKESFFFCHKFFPILTIFISNGIFFQYNLRSQSKTL